MIKIAGVTYYTTQEAADMLGIHRKSIWLAAKEGRLAAAKGSNGALLITEQDAIAFRDAYKAEGDSVTDLAQRFGKSRQGVTLALARLGIEPVGQHLVRFGKMSNVYDPEEARTALKSIGWEEHTHEQG